MHGLADCGAHIPIMVNIMRRQRAQHARAVGCHVVGADGRVAEKPEQQEGGEAGRDAGGAEGLDAEQAHQDGDRDAHHRACTTTQGGPRVTQKLASLHATAAAAALRRMQGAAPWRPGTVAPWHRSAPSPMPSTLCRSPEMADTTEMAGVSTPSASTRHAATITATSSAPCSAELEASAPRRRSARLRRRGRLRSSSCALVSARAKPDSACSLSHTAPGGRTLEARVISE